MNNWIKSDHFIASVNEVFGKSLLAINHAHTADGGALYRIERKLVAKVFTTSNFKVFTEGIFHKHAVRIADLITAQNGKVDMHIVSSQYTLQSIFDIACGVPLESIDKNLGVQFIESMDFVFITVLMRMFFKPYFKYFWWCMLSEYRTKRKSKVLLDLMDGTLTKRLHESEAEIAKRSDLLSLFIKKARELEGEGDAQTKIVKELKTVDTKALTYEDVKKLKYLDAFVWETMRLNPTVTVSFKQAAEDDVLPDGVFVPAGTDILYSTYHMGRSNAKSWGEDQLDFRPGRWLEMKTRPSAYKFPLFHGGPRICPGMSMMLLETKIFIAIVLVLVLEKFHVKIQDGEQLKDRGYSLSTTLTMEGGLPLQMTPRV